MSVSILDVVKELLAERKHSQTYQGIADATGTSYDDVKRLAKGKASGMGVQKVQAVYEHLSGKPLFDRI